MISVTANTEEQSSTISRWHGDTPLHGTVMQKQLKSESGTKMLRERFMLQVSS